MVCANYTPTETRTADMTAILGPAVTVFDPLRGPAVYPESVTWRETSYRRWISGLGRHSDRQCQLEPAQ